MTIDYGRHPQELLFNITTSVPEEFSLRTFKIWNNFDRELDLCAFSANCFDTPELLAEKKRTDLGTFETNQTHLFFTTVSYHCGDGMAFRDPVTLQLLDRVILECDKTSNVFGPGTLGTCECNQSFFPIASASMIPNFIADLYCPSPIMPNVSYNLEPINYNGSVIPFNTAVPYGCRNGMKFYKQFDLDFEMATCLTGNVWSIPVPDGWSNCVESKLLSLCNQIGMNVT